MKAVVLNVHKRRGGRYGVDLEVEVPEDFAAAAAVMQALAWVKEGAVVALVQDPGELVKENLAREADLRAANTTRGPEIHSGDPTIRAPELSFEHPAAPERTEPASAFDSPTVCGIEASTDPTLRCVAIKGHMKGKNPSNHNFVKVAAND